MNKDSLNLNSPPGFRCLNPDLPLTMYRRHLPHWRQPGATYFVTFRAADAIPQQQLQALKRWRSRWERENPEPRRESDWHEFAKEITTRTERYLDQGYGECLFSNTQAAEEMSRTLLYFQDIRLHVGCFAVMHNHVHSVIRPLGEFQLEDVLESVKGFVSRKVNRLVGRKGKLWEQESFDRIIRDEDHLYRVVQYIGNNPRKAGYPKSAWVRWIDPSWQDCGWGFRDE